MTNLLDGTDRAIISQLQYDGRLPFTEIAARIGLSEGTVRRRVKRLTEAGADIIVAPRATPPQADTGSDESPKGDRPSQGGRW